MSLYLVRREVGMGERPNGGLVCLLLDNVKSISEESKNETLGSCRKPIILDLFSRPTKC